MTVALEPRVAVAPARPPVTTLVERFWDAVMITHRNVDAAMRHFTSRIPVSSGDRVISYLPLAHVAERLASEYR